jgi:hypothetical protein
MCAVNIGLTRKLTFLEVEMVLLPAILERSLKSAVYELVLVAKIFDQLGRDEDSKYALETARDLCGMFPDPE